MTRTNISGNSNLWASDGSGVVQQDAITIAHLYEFYFDTPQFCTDYGSDLTYTSAVRGSSETYGTSLAVVGMSVVNESSKLQVGKISIEISAHDPSDVELFLNNDLINKRIVVYRAYIDDDGVFESGSPYMFFDGNIESYAIKESPEGAAITVTIASHYANFLQTNGRKTNPNSQQNAAYYNNTSQKFSDDRGMEFASSMVKDIKWGQE